MTLTRHACVAFYLFSSLPSISCSSMIDCKRRVFLEKRRTGIPIPFERNFE